MYFSYRLSSPVAVLLFFEVTAAFLLYVVALVAIEASTKTFHNFSELHGLSVSKYYNNITQQYCTLLTMILHITQLTIIHASMVHTRRRLRPACRGTKHWQNNHT